MDARAGGPFEIAVVDIHDGDGARAEMTFEPLEGAVGDDARHGPWAERYRIETGRLGVAIE